MENAQKKVDEDEEDGEDPEMQSTKYKNSISFFD